MTEHELRAALQRVIDLMREREWVVDGYESVSYCVYCGCAKYNGHDPECEAFGSNGVTRTLDDDSFARS